MARVANDLDPGMHDGLGLQADPRCKDLLRLYIPPGGGGGVLDVLTTTTHRRWRNRNDGVKTAAWRTFRRRSTLHHAGKNKWMTVQGSVKKPQVDYYVTQGGISVGLDPPGSPTHTHSGQCGTPNFSAITPPPRNFFGLCVLWPPLPAFCLFPPICPHGGKRVLHPRRVSIQNVPHETGNRTMPSKPAKQMNPVTQPPPPPHRARRTALTTNGAECRRESRTTGAAPR